MRGVAPMRVGPPDMLNTLPSGSWLGQTSAGGQRSGLAFLYPNPPWVPTYPLSRGSPFPVTHMAWSFFCASVLVLLSLSLIPVVVCLPHFLSLLLFFFFLIVKKPAKEATPSIFWFLCLYPVSLSLHPLLPALFPAVALQGSVYSAAAEAGFICPKASFWKGTFNLWRIARCPQWHWTLNCTTSKFDSFVLYWESEMFNWFFSWPAGLGIPFGIYVFTFTFWCAQIAYGNVS